MSDSSDEIGEKHFREANKDKPDLKKDMFMLDPQTIKKQPQLYSNRESEEKDMVQDLINFNDPAESEGDSSNNQKKVRKYRLTSFRIIRNLRSKSLWIRVISRLLKTIIQ